MKGSPKVYCERGVTIERIITIVQMGMGKGILGKEGRRL